MLRQSVIIKQNVLTKLEEEAVHHVVDIDSHGKVCIKSHAQVPYSVTVETPTDCGRQCEEITKAKASQ